MNLKDNPDVHVLLIPSSFRLRENLDSTPDEVAQRIVQEMYEPNAVTLLPADHEYMAEAMDIAISRITAASFNPREQNVPEVKGTRIRYQIIGKEREVDVRVYVVNGRATPKKPWIDFQNPAPYGIVLLEPRKEASDVG